MKNPIEKGGFPLPWLVYWRAHISTTVKLPFEIFCFNSSALQKWHQRFDVRLVSGANGLRGEQGIAQLLLGILYCFDTWQNPVLVEPCVMYTAKYNIKRWSENKESTPIFLRNNQILTPVWSFQFFWGWFSNSSVLVDASHQTEVTSAWLDLSASFTSASTLATWLD